MTLRKKTFLMVAIVLPSYLIAILLMIVTSNNASAAVAKFSSNTYQLEVATRAIENDFNTYDGQMNAYVLAAATTPGPLVSQSLANAQQANAAIWADISNVKRLGGNNSQISQGITAVVTGLNGYQGFAEQAIQAANSKNYRQAAQIQSVSNNNATNTLVNGITILKSAVDRLVHSGLSSVQSMQRTAVLLAILTGLLILLAMTGAITVLFRTVLKPLFDIAKTMREVSGNADSATFSIDLTPRLNLNRSDELGELAQTLDNLLDSLTVTVKEISNSSYESSAASDQLASTSSRLSESLDTTVARVTQISSSAQIVGNNVSMVSDSTKQMYEAIQEISRGTSSATQVALRAVGSANSAVKVVSRLGESSKMIETVVQVITSIAEQTNLLALNATIEAARAGTAGKGFAVVASEVKDLAKKTSEATGEISKMITTIQEDTSSAVAAIDEISTIISQISDLQSTIASAVEEQSATTAEIGYSIGGAAASATDIAAQINDVETGTQDVKTTATMTMEAANDLKLLSQRLSLLVKKFKFDDLRGATTIAKTVTDARRPRFQPKDQLEATLETR